MSCIISAVVAQAAWADETFEKHQPAMDARTAADEQVVEILLAPLGAEGQEGESRGLIPMVTRLVQNTLSRVPAVKLTPPGKLPELDKRFVDFSALASMERLALIDLKNQTGLDGVIFVSWRWEEASFELALGLVDLRNGRVHLSRKFSEPFGAVLLSHIEEAIEGFAISIRRSIRVTIQVTSEPEGCEVFVNDQPVGKTPQTVELRTGTYRLRVEHEGYRPHLSTHDLSDGDRLELHAVLQNPLAARFLNAPPGLRVDSRELSAGYRYVFVNSDEPAWRHGHSLLLDGTLRINDWQAGLRFGFSAFESHQRLDTFLGQNEGDFVLQHNLIQLMALCLYPVWEKYSFAHLKLGAAAGLAWSSAKSAARSTDKWTGAADLFAQAEVRLLRSGNFGIDLLLSLGFSYLGELPYLEKTFSLFGEGEERVRNRHMFGPTGSAALQFKWYNDIF
ncbi:MAG: PEGA domain-containing protein [Myxococcales bacterium]|nr:PEGA domain-containing protein [Myxococcales bacterium]